jgi:hypothetical protein
MYDSRYVIFSLSSLSILLSLSTINTIRSYQLVREILLRAEYIKITWLERA